MLLQAESRLHSLVSQCEQKQQKIRELEVELADTSTKPSSLQEELQTERAKLAAANKKVTANSSRIPLENHVGCDGEFPDGWYQVPIASMSVGAS